MRRLCSGIRGPMQQRYRSIPDGPMASGQGREGKGGVLAAVADSQILLSCGRSTVKGF
jgi:hypothetical protein